MNLIRRIERSLHWALPSPLAIALVLTGLSFVLAGLWGDIPSDQARGLFLLESWREGLFHPPLVVFLVQMMLILVLGHTLALAPVVRTLITRLLRITQDAPSALALTCGATMLVGFFNWGLGLIFGAVMARQMGEHLRRRGATFQYGLLGAAGYSGMLIWHGGLSGSAPVKVAEKGHLTSLVEGGHAQLSLVPERLGLEHTLLSPMNISVGLAMLIVLPLLTFLIARRSSAPQASWDFLEQKSEPEKEKEKPAKPQGAEHLDQSLWIGRILGVIWLFYALFQALEKEGMSFLTPNYINFGLLALSFLAHGSLNRFSAALGQAITGAAGILIQFPLYFGIMGLMRDSGLVTLLSKTLSDLAGPTSFPLFTFFSAAVINVFVPSGGGQWAIQGPVIIEAVQELGIDLGHTIMAMAYGDQLTNMLQPFWALPLLGITGLKAREILPYTLLYLLAGGLVYSLAIFSFGA